jgi:hypothetical protein
MKDDAIHPIPMLQEAEKVRFLSNIDLSLPTDGAFTYIGPTNFKEGYNTRFSGWRGPSCLH